eukprot:m.119034 g.119034  ORF g.119034 m.119034 type:complete len:171 (+) comp16142_c5_seq1:238-750(+)
MTATHPMELSYPSSNALPTLSDDGQSMLLQPPQQPHQQQEPQVQQHQQEQQQQPKPPPPLAPAETASLGLDLNSKDGFQASNSMFLFGQDAQMFASIDNFAVSNMWSPLKCGGPADTAREGSATNNNNSSGSNSLRLSRQGSAMLLDNPPSFTGRLAQLGRPTSSSSGGL